MMESFFYVYAAAMGLCFGSFANVLIHRLPHNKSFITPPSHCPACNQRLLARDLVPVLSWIFLKGRCRFCGVHIRMRYPAVEAACGLLFMGMAMYVGGSWLDAVPLCVLAFVLLTVAVIDWDTQEIPDGLLLVGGLAGAAWVGGGYFLPATLNAPEVSDALWGALAGALPLLLLDRLVLLLLKKDGFGFGDVKMMAMVGLFLGWQGTLAAFFFAFISGGCYAAFLLVTKRSERGAYMPFGPFLAAGSVAALWWGGEVISYFLIFPAP